MLTLQSVNAQRKEGKTRTPEQMVEKLDKKLNLTDEQEKQITRFILIFSSRIYHAKNAKVPCRNWKRK